MTSSRSNTSAIRSAHAPARAARCSRLARVGFLALAALAAVLVPAQAAAKKRIVILDFEGPGADKLTRQVRILLGKRHAVVSASLYRREAEEMGAARPTKANVARVAERLAVDGLVVGESLARRGRYRLTVRLRSGRSGEFVQTIAVRLAEPKLTKDAARHIWRMLMPAIGKLPPIGIVGGGDGDSASKKREARRGRNKREARRARNKREARRAQKQREARRAQKQREARRAREDDESDDAASAATGSGAIASENPLAPAKETDSEPAAEVSEAAPEEDPGPSPFEIAGGLSVTTRSLTFTHEPGLDDSPQDYAGKPVPGAYLEGAVYPAAFSDDAGALAGLGLSFVIDKVLKIESEVNYMGEVTSLPTSQARYGIGALYRHQFGANGPTVKAGVRLNSLSFSIDKTMSPIELDIPNVDYTYLDPGVRLRYPFGAVSGFAEVRALLPLTAGEVQKIDQYGTATMFGIDLDLGIEYALSPKVAVRAGGRLTRIAFDFDGSGARTNRDGDPQADVGGALDQYLGGYVTVGYAF